MSTIIHTSPLPEVEIPDVTITEHVEEIVFATIFLLILLVRFIYMRSTRPTALPNDADRTISRLARFVHLGMYLSLSMLATTGLMIGGVFASGIREGMTFAIVLWAHEAFYWASVNLIIVHVLAALYHRHLADGVWNAMVPVFREKSTPNQS